MHHKIIFACNLIRVRCPDDTVFKVSTDRKLQKKISMLVIQSEKKEHVINCMRRECMVVSKRDIICWELYNGDVKLNKAHKCNSQIKGLRDNGKCKTEIRNYK